MHENGSPFDSRPDAGAGRRRWMFGLGIAAVVCAAYVAGRGSRPSAVRGTASAARRVLYYVDPMHPAYRSDRPGKAPDCGMDLEPVYAGGASAPPAAMSRRQRPPDTGPGTGSSSRDRDGADGARHTRGAHRGPRGAGRSPDVSCFGRRGRLGAPRVLGPDRNPGEARRGTGGLLQQRHLGAAAGLRLRAGILRTVEDRRPRLRPNHWRSPRSSWPRRATTSSSSEWARRRSRNSAVPVARVFDVNLTAPADGQILERHVAVGQRFMKGELLYRIANLERVWVLADVHAGDAALLRRHREARDPRGGPAAVGRARRAGSSAIR